MGQVDNNFTQAMKFISKWEWMDRDDGAYTNDPKDPGGETKFGISKRSHSDVDVANLTLANSLQIYYQEYWLKYGLDSQSFPFSVAALDTYVQHLPGVAAKLLKDSEGSIQKLLEGRRIFYLNLIGKNPSLLKFKKGWLNRMNDLSKYCSILSQNLPSV
jgi:hypothetical protein